MNITNVYLLTDYRGLCYSRVRVCIKGTLNLSLDNSCGLCLWLARGSYTGSHTRVYVNIHRFTAPDVGIGFALARCVPMLGLWITFVGLVDNSAPVCNLWIT